MPAAAVPVPAGIAALLPVLETVLRVLVTVVRAEVTGALMLGVGR
jgi:hypothetical protein